MHLCHYAHGTLQDLSSYFLSPSLFLSSPVSTTISFFLGMHYRMPYSGKVSLVQMFCINGLIRFRINFRFFNFVCMRDCTRLYTFDRRSKVASGLNFRMFKISQLLISYVSIRKFAPYESFPLYVLANIKLPHEQYLCTWKRIVDLLSQHTSNVTGLVYRA